MSTDDNKQSAWIRFDGEPKRLLIRRPRFYSFGRRSAAQTVTLTTAELQALLDGRVAAVNVLDEFVVYFRVEIGASHSTQNARPAVAEDTTRPRYSQRVRVRAAQVRLAADRRRGVSTPKWIVDLASPSEEVARKRGRFND